LRENKYSLLIEESIWLNLDMQTIITIKPILHRGEEQLAIFFPFNKNIDYAVRSVKGVKWTQTYKCWYLPLNKESFETVKNKLNNLGNLDFASTQNIYNYTETKETFAIA